MASKRQSKIKLPKLELGARFLGKGKTAFRVWVPRCQSVQILLDKRPHRLILMKKDRAGYFSAQVAGVFPGDTYRYVLDGQRVRPDPASRFQPRGVHDASCVVDPTQFKWQDASWRGVSEKELIFYELHIGTFTKQGTFDAAIKKIPYLKALGVTCIEIMPVAQFPGKRNWGYDGVGLYAVQNSYGGPNGLKRLVNACHRAGLAVCLDVVYNHFGPEGNYLNDFGPYFTKKYHTPWGDAVNYDDMGSSAVRNFIIQNALYWINEYHIDALRLDAIHGIYDRSPRHILQVLNDTVRAQTKKLGRPIYLIAESDLNDSKVIRPKKQGGYGLAGQWSDDFHHAVHAYLTKERGGYYADFGKLKDIAKALGEGFVYDGNYSAFRKRKHGNAVKDLNPRKLVVCVQNHDQIGNRAWGERLSVLTDFDNLKLAATLLLLAPNTPMLFMGEEYAEAAPFQYFIHHADPGLVNAVQEGRKREFQKFGWKTVPDPQSSQTYLQSQLRWSCLRRKPYSAMLRLYTDLIQIRKKYITSQNTTLRRVICNESECWLRLEYARHEKIFMKVIFVFGNKKAFRSLCDLTPNFEKVFSTTNKNYSQTAADQSAGAAVFIRKENR